MTSKDRFVPGPRWRSIAAIWGGIGLVDATQTVVSMKAMGMHHAWVELFLFQLLGWLPWALATPWVMRLSVRAPLRLRWQNGCRETATALRAWGLHGANWMALSMVASLWVGLTENLLNPWNPNAPPPAAVVVICPASGR